MSKLSWMVTYVKAADLLALIATGEGQTLEFKRCGHKPERDVFETICAFANRQGGTILLGVLDDGSVSGVDASLTKTIQRNIANVVNNPSCFNAAPPIETEAVELDGTSVIRVWVSMGPSVYRFKGTIYDRIFDSDIRVTSDDAAAALYIRKKNIYTERRILPYLTMADLRPDLIERVRHQIAARRAGHPWLNLSDEELLRSARLWGRDEETGKTGYNLACALLLGTDETVLAAAPAYRTDALLRRRDTNRYDDRLIVETNLIESHDALTDFAERWLPDPFFLEQGVRLSLRSIIVRELVSNCLMHREYTSPYPARIQIDEAGISTKNASRSMYSATITPDTLNPTPKNPIIANFFTQLGLAETLGSGTRTLFRYARHYGGKDPKMRDGDFFEAFVAAPTSDAPEAEADGSSSVWDVALRRLSNQDTITSSEIAEEMGVSARTARRKLKALVDEGRLMQEGARKSVRYRLPT